MKKGLLAIAFILGYGGWNTGYSATAISPGPVNPVINWLDMKASDFVKLSVKDFSKITGKKLNLKEKFAFFVMKKNMKHVMKKNPNLTVRDYLTSNHKKMETGVLIILIVVAVLVIVIIVASSTSFSMGGVGLGG